eukprot:GHVS01036288.1.p1 GENE.GHVS01036288.1~~GHVS01036288.1.p1  ORF type:complete len:908 (+),score=114.28 GHVS01036288.1:19-2742(+)
MSRCRKSTAKSCSGAISPSFEGKLAEKCSLPFAADSQVIALRGFRDYTSLKLKPDNPNRPIWVCEDGYIYLELFLPVSKQASDFLITMAEPMCRPELIHEFQITVFSLYAGLSVGLSVGDLLSNLNKFSKNELPEELIATIKRNAEVFGKVKLVLRDNKHWIESGDKEELDLLTSNQMVNAARKRKRTGHLQSSHATLGAALTQVFNVEDNPCSHMGEKPSECFRGGSMFSDTVMADDALPRCSPEGSAVGGQNRVKEEEDASRPTRRSPSSSIVSGSNVGGDYVTTAAPVLDTSSLAFKLTEQTDEATACSSDIVKAEAVAGGSDCTARTGGGTAPKAAESSAASKEVYSFEVEPNMIENVKRVCLEQLQRPLVMEYDFRKDRNNPNVDMTLRSSTSIRYYQERALRKMFSNGRARSGIIVLPCGAGKTLTGITAACTMRKSAIILTTSAVAVDQWQKQFEQFTTINPRYVKTLTSEAKSDLWPMTEGGILVSTYTMLAYSGKRSEAAERILDQIRSREWGLLIFDEVQFAPAPAFRRVNATIRSHCKLGLTATLVREDDLIKDLQWLIGPKLYEANWLELQERGFLAKAQCSEVWCPMTKEFYREYLRGSHAKQRKLWVCNPNKMMACEFLLRYHEARGDKVIVFSDNLFALDNAARALHKPFISGAVSMAERMTIINMFKTDPTFNTLFLSKVGDNAIDIPCANVVIQISFNFASRRQEAQRLGRILRPKPRSGDDFNAFFYSLVSKDTQEMIYADKRQQFIIDQGYSYKVLHSSALPMEEEELVYKSPEKQKQVLAQILMSDDNQNDFDADETGVDSVGRTATTGDGRRGDAGVVQLQGGLASLSGAGGVHHRSSVISSTSGFSRVTTTMGRGGRGSASQTRQSVKQSVENMHSMFRTFHKKK